MLGVFREYNGSVLDSGSDGSDSETVLDFSVPAPQISRSHRALNSSTDLRSLPDVAMTGTCTRECTEFGHSDSCWMPGQPSPNRNKTASKGGPKLSTFVPYQEREPQDQLMANGSPKPMGEEHGGGSKMGTIRFLPPYTSAYSAGGDAGKDCPLEEIPLSQTADYPSATTPSSQGSKREIYL